MNKEQLLALCARLGISTNVDMTVSQLNELVSTWSPATAVVANATTGKSTVKTFRYSKSGYCIATLSNGVQGIVGDTHSCSLRDMLALKGSGIQVAYLENGNSEPIDGKVYKRYRLEWSLE